jgi:hypothetical protein
MSPHRDFEKTPAYLATNSALELADIESFNDPVLEKFVLEALELPFQPSAHVRFNQSLGAAIRAASSDALKLNLAVLKLFSNKRLHWHRVVAGEVRS